jgi:hypothetical protein
VDRDGSGYLPPDTEVESWLRSRAEDAWVEVATTVETWVSTDRATASRRRTRAWAMLDRGHPSFVASRDWAELQGVRWETDPPIDGQAGRSGTTSVVFRPEAAASIVRALVLALHGTQAVPRTSVGPGWVIEDRPRDEHALFGGTFDDLLHPTESVCFAAGGTTHAGVATTGQARRASYRDRPEPTASCLVVTPPKIELNGSEVVAARARIHPLGSEWVVEIEPGPGWIRTTPLDLAQRCLGGVGESRRSYRGVTTPGLLFGDLVVRW